MKRIGTLSIIAIFSLACAAASGAAEPAGMKAILTVPHEFDMLVKSGHIQGLACSEKGIYLSHQLGLAKIGWDGKLVKHIEDRLCGRAHLRRVHHPPAGGHEGRQAGASACLGRGPESG